ncbi:MAG: hypothetical protein M5U15_08765 [Kiritimatiellae bacterium]|nr:hypothetical protein [Kiritimatiellia bacterium]
MGKKANSPGALVRAWFAVTPQERRLLFGILAVTLLGFTLRYFYLRASEPTATEPPGNAGAFNP